MSVIFKALEKLRQHSNDNESAMLAVEERRSTFQRLFCSRAFVISVVVIIFTGGFAAVFGVQYLKKTLDGFQPPAAAAAAGVAPERHVVTGRIAPLDALEAGDAASRTTAVSGRSAGGVDDRELPDNAEGAPMSSKAAVLESDDASDTPVRYVPPRRETADSENTSTQYIAESRGSVPVESTGAQYAALSDPPSDSDAYPATGPWGAENLEAAADGLVPVAGEKWQEREKPSQYRAALSAEPSVRSHPAAPFQMERTAPDRSQAPFDYFGGPVTDHAAAKARISAMVHRLYSAMARMDAAETESVLEDLTAVKGENDLFILKLRAYWMLRTEQYESAGALLGTVLAISPEDMEAGINMAVVEIKTDRLAAARQRLHALNEQYPENGTIADMLLKVN